MPSNSDSDGWITVSRQEHNKKRIAKQKRSNIRRSNQRNKQRINNAIINTTSEKECDVNISLPELHSIVRECHHEFEQTDLYQAHLMSLCENYIEKFAVMVCYGIGSFSKSKASQWQLACALSLRNLLGITSTYYYEPYMTETESQILQDEFGIQILTTNERGCRSVDGKATLFFMPHCPQLLYHNVLYTNWMTLDKVCIIGNSLSGYALNQIGTITPAIATLLPYIKEEKMILSTKDTTSHAYFENAFNDSSWMHIIVKDDEIPTKPTSQEASDDSRLLEEII
mmetsp:Transcript_14172/g.21840  ORF Transcript_14172/g.21840 Transcript_14172/m.21840 type:complete len:284 (+) Transcript_14172:26-877(+)